VRLVLRRSRPRRCGRLRRGGGCLGGRLHSGGPGLRLVLLETALFVFAARAARTGLVPPGSRTGLSSHWNECTAPAELEGPGAR
jgi:hypothetical protein